MLDQIGIENDGTARLWERNLAGISDVIPGHPIQGERLLWRRISTQKEFPEEFSPSMEETFEVKGNPGPSPSKKSLEDLWAPVKIRRVSFYPRAPLQQLEAVLVLEEPTRVEISFSGAFEGKYVVDLAGSKCSAASCFVAIRLEDIFELLKSKVPLVISKIVKQTMV